MEMKHNKLLLLTAFIAGAPSTAAEFNRYVAMCDVKK